MVVRGGEGMEKWEVGGVCGWVGVFGEMLFGGLWGDCVDKGIRGFE